MKKNILEYWLIGLTLVSGFLSFLTVYRAIKVADSSTWAVPMILFSIFITLLLTLTIFARSTIEVEIVALTALMTSIFFAFTFWHFIVLLVGGFLALSALANVRKDLDLNVKISLWKSLYTGKVKFIFAIAIIICSQYFFTIKTMSGQIKVPKIDMSGISSKIVKPIFGEINPGYKLISDENLTVDQYILQAQANNGPDPIMSLDLSQDNDFIDQQIPKNLPQTQQDLIKQQALEMRAKAQSQLSEKNKELILKEGRNQISKVLGKDVTGNEMMADVIVSPVSSAVNRYFQVNVSGANQSPIFPLILSVVLFFTLWSLGSILCVLWFSLVILIFKLLVRLNIITVKKIMVEREMIS